MTTFNNPEALARPSSEALDAILGSVMPVLDHGFIRVVDYMGDEAAIVQAARVSYGKGTQTPSDDRNLLRYLMRHHHSTPFEMCELKLHVKLPIFVARQWIRHRTANVNEYSARYSILAREFHLPGWNDLAPQSKTNKQGRAGSYSDNDQVIIRRVMERAMDEAFNVYDALIDDDGNGYDLARETAREVLPLSTYTEWYWKIDLHNLLHFLKLRKDPHAQKEIRVYADKIGEVVESWMPTVWAAFEDYTLGAHTFSKQEMAILRKMVQPDFGSYVDDDMVAGISNRELAAFRAALGLGD